MTLPSFRVVPEPRDRPGLAAYRVVVLGCRPAAGVIEAEGLGPSGAALPPCGRGSAGSASTSGVTSAGPRRPGPRVR